MLNLIPLEYIYARIPSPQHPTYTHTHIHTHARKHTNQ